MKLLMLVAGRAMAMLPMVAAQIKTHIEADEIVVIAPAALKDRILAVGGGISQDISFLDEDTVVEGLTYDSLRALIGDRSPEASARTGWYLQQFLKMGYARMTDDAAYLIWDADTMPLKRICMFHEDGRPYFDIKDEYHPPYFATMERLFEGTLKKTGDFSYISEHMLIETAYMRELLEEIERNDTLPGATYYEKIIHAVEIPDLKGSGFSEFETYGCFTDTHHPGAYVRRTLKTFRRGDELMKADVDERLKEYVFQTYDTISFENRDGLFSDGG